MMARNRMIKPEFWSSEQVVECSLRARLLFIGLWNFADDAGVQPDRPLRLLMLIFPGDDITTSDIGPLLDQLEQAKLIRRYVVEGQGFIAITGWHHQKIDRPTYRYPPPPPDSGESATPHRDVDDRSLLTRTRKRTRKRPPKSPPGESGRAGELDSGKKKTGGGISNGLDLEGKP